LPHVPDLAGEFSETALLRTFLVGIVLGLAAAAGALYAIPVIDQHREASIIRVAPNGSNTETLHVNIPMDRIMAGDAGATQDVPAGLQWPTANVLAGVRTEVFKLRNANDMVVGVGVRTAAERDDGSVIDWALHLPARGSMFVAMEATPRDGGFRIGNMLTGSREFASLTGVLTERWVADTSGEEDAPLGRIELRTTYVGEAERLNDNEVVE
jgi:hypothetical protein